MPKRKNENNYTTDTSKIRILSNQLNNQISQIIQANDISSLKDILAQSRQDIIHTALHSAVQQGSLEMVQSIIDESTSLNIKIDYNNDYNKPLLHLAIEQDQEIVELLIQVGAYLNHLDNEDNTILCSAAKKGATKVVQLLLDKKVDVQAYSNNKTALHLASEQGHTEVVKLLIAKGADLNKTICYNPPPLHLASAQGHTEVVKLLIEKGADLNKMAIIGQPPLYFAMQGNHVEIVKILLGKGADVTPVYNEHSQSSSIATSLVKMAKVIDDVYNHKTSIKNINITDKQDKELWVERLKSYIKKDNQLNIDLNNSYCSGSSHEIIDTLNDYLKEQQEDFKLHEALLLANITKCEIAIPLDKLIDQLLSKQFRFEVDNVKELASHYKKLVTNDSLSELKDLLGILENNACNDEQLGRLKELVQTHIKPGSYLDSIKAFDMCNAITENARIMYHVTALYSLPKPSLYSQNFLTNIIKSYSECSNNIFGRLSLRKCCKPDNVSVECQTTECTDLFEDATKLSGDMLDSHSESQ